MVERPINGHHNKSSHLSENNPANDISKEDQDIIELSDIAVGITPEDDAIVEMTEDIIGEAFFGFDKATSDKIHADESEMDLSEKRQPDGLTGQPDDSYRPPFGQAPSGGLTVISGREPDPQEEDISRKLDNYFGVEEDDVVRKKLPEIPDIVETFDEEAIPAVMPAPTPIQKAKPVSDISITASQLDEALERVIRKLYAEKINRILDAMIERTVTEEISQLKDYLIGIADKKS
jgi:hypothetical protein